MWIIDKIRDLLDFGDHSSSLKRDPAEILERIGQLKTMPWATEPVETLQIDYDGLPLPAHGVLKDMGYRVGKSGLSLLERHEILRRTFMVQLVCPGGAADEYIAQWGERCTYARFVKMDNVLGGLAANAERKTKTDMSEAIRNWREDQKWLRDIYKEWMNHTH